MKMRRAAYLTILTVLVTLVAAGCGSADEQSAAPDTAAVARSSGPPAVFDSVAGLRDRSSCTTTIGPDEAQTTTASAATAVVLQTTVNDAGPGDVICVVGGHYETPIQIEASGEEGRLLIVQGFGGARIGGFEVRADHVGLAGFTISDGPVGSPGIAVRGEGVQVVGNVISNPGGDGIACERSGAQCKNVLIANNTIDGADGSGVIIYGTRVTVQENEITGSVQREASDADGIRFFGSGHVIRGNRIHDIFDRGYTGPGPHTDCFQTFDESDTPSRNVLIDGNVCENVDHQCLIATATASRDAGEIGRSGGIRFLNNICDTNGSQAILISEFPRVLVANNIFLDGIEFQAIAAIESSTGLRVLNNIMLGTYVPYNVAEDSRTGFVADHNLQYDETLGPPPSVWAESSGQWDVDPKFVAPGAADPARRYGLANGSPAIDHGTPIDGTELDFLGNPRVADGDGDNDARVDIGPIEVQPATSVSSEPSP